MELDKEGDARSAIASRLHAALGTTAADLFAVGIVNTFADYYIPNPPPGTYAFIYPRRLWVIHNEDLKLLDVFGNAIGPVVLLLASAVMGGPAAATIAAGAATVVGLAIVVFNRCRTLGVAVDSVQVQILLALQSNPGGATSSAVADWLNMNVGGSRGWTPAEAQHNLVDISKLRRKNGGPGKLIEEIGESTWIACDL